jgi:hypothetical protein
MPPTRPLSRGLRRLLLAAAVLDLLAGTQASILSAHTGLFFAWPIASPLTAAFVGASFWAAGVLIYWSSRQETFVRARVTVPAIAVVVTTLLIATVRHLDTFLVSPLGPLWIEIYVLIGPIVAVVLALQLAVPGRDHHSGRRLPPGLRLGLAAQGTLMLAAGATLFFAPGQAHAIWPWAVNELSSQTIGGWLLGIGVTAAYVVLHDDREDLPGVMPCYVVLGGSLLAALARYPDALDASGAAIAAYAAFWASTVALGATGTRLAHRDGRYVALRPPGGIPVEVVAASAPPAAEREWPAQREWPAESLA